MLTPSAHGGRGTWGNVNNTWPGNRLPKMTWITTRMTMTTRPNRKNTISERDHGAAVLRAETTKAVTEAMSTNSSGLVVLMAAPARQPAHSHQAAGCSARRSGAVDRRRVIGCADADAIGVRPRLPVRRRSLR